MKVIIIVLLSSFFCLNSFSQNQQKTVNISSFISQDKETSDYTSSAKKAIDFCKKSKAAKLIFPKGTYEFWPNQAENKYIAISNNDSGIKRLIYDLSDMENFEIDGQGSTFLFHGFEVPFLISNSKNIRIKNLTVDWQRTFNSQGKIIDATNEYIDLEIGEQYPYKIDNGCLVFFDKNEVVYPYGSLLEFDSEKSETAFMATDIWLRTDLPAKSLGQGKVRLFVSNYKVTPGNVLVFGPRNRLAPAFIVSDSEDVLVEKTNIYHAGGMGIIAQRTHNVTISEVNVTPKPGSNRMISTTADATHFTNCSGKVTLKNCLFENQLDDATNIHGIYLKVAKKISAYEIEVKLVHPQQFGFDFLKKDMKVEFTHGRDLVMFANRLVKSVKKVNEEYTRVTFNQELPKDLIIGVDVIASAELGPEVLIKDCIIRNNRARGILLGSRRKTIIEGNTFHTPGAAILFEGDAQYWFERSGVRDVLISKNLFDNCNYGIWGNSVIQIGSTIDKVYRDKSRYNSNIRIIDNQFKIFDPRILNLYSVTDITFQNNSILKSSEYPNLYKNDKQFVIENSSNVKLTDSLK